MTTRDGFQLATIMEGDLKGRTCLILAMCILKKVKTAIIEVNGSHMYIEASILRNWQPVKGDSMNITKNKNQLATIKSGLLKGKRCLILNQFNTSDEEEMSLVQIEGQEIVIESSRLRKWLSVKSVSIKDGVVTIVPPPSEECEKINPVWRSRDTLKIVPGPDEESSDMKLKNCPFCKANTVFKDNFIWNNKEAVKCGCQTLGCRGNIHNSPHYNSFKDMWKKWNRRH